MKVPLHVVKARRAQLAAWMQQQSYIPIRAICERFAISEATARRDLAALAAEKQIVRTWGGALGEFSQRFPSFRERQGLAVEAKRKIAHAVHDVLQPDSTCFFDSGSTVFAIAEELHRRPIPGIRVVTNNIPVAELLGSSPGMNVQLLGGRFVHRQSVLLGNVARKVVRFHNLDQAIFGAEGVDEAGVWNSQADVVTLQRAVLERAPSSILCVDHTKVGHAAPSFLAPWDAFDLVVTDSARAKILCGAVRATVVK